MIGLFKFFTIRYLTETLHSGVLLIQCTSVIRTNIKNISLQMVIGLIISYPLISKALHCFYAYFGLITSKGFENRAFIPLPVFTLCTHASIFSSAFKLKTAAACLRTDCVLRWEMIMVTSNPLSTHSEQNTDNRIVVHCIVNPNKCSTH